MREDLNNKMQPAMEHIRAGDSKQRSKEKSFRQEEGRTMEERPISLGAQSEIW